MTAISIPSDGYLLTDDDPQPIRFRWIYDTSKPFSVFVKFEVGETVTWELSREHLREALAKYEAVGDGEAIIAHFDGEEGEDDQITLHLISPDGEALVSASDVPARHWLVQSHLLVPKGAEDVSASVDAAIAGCLGEVAS